MDWIKWWLENSSSLERVGLVAFMFFIIVSGFAISVWLFRYAQQQADKAHQRTLDCEERERIAFEARLEDTKERGEIKQELGKLTGRVEGLAMTKEQLEAERAAHIEAIKAMMTSSLEMVNKGNARGN